MDVYLGTCSILSPCHSHLFLKMFLIPELSSKLSIDERRTFLEQSAYLDLVTMHVVGE